MPAPYLPSLERRLEALMLELERLYQARPGLPDVLARAGAGQRIDELLDEIAELEREISLARASTLADAAVQLRRLAASIDGGNEVSARLLASALGAVERAVEQLKPCSCRSRVGAYRS